MSINTEITCACGQRVPARDIIQRGEFFSMLSPGCVYVRYRCSRCKRIGKRFVRQVKGLEGRLAGIGVELPAGERARFIAMGAIDLDEVVDFHNHLRDAALADVFPG